MTTKITNDNITSVDASKLTGSLPGGMAPETDLSSVRSDILKLALHQAIDGNRVAYNLEDSFVDGFEDNSGITLETTVDRDATGEYVSSIVRSSKIDAIESEWANSSSSPAATSARTFSTNNITFTSGDDALWLNETFTGNFEVELTWHNGSYTGLDWAFGISFVADEPGVLTSTQQRQYYNPSAWIRSGGYPYHQSTSEGGTRLFDIGSVILLKRVGSVFTIYDDGVLDHTYTYTNSAECRFGMTSGGGATNWELRDIKYLDGTGTIASTVNATGTLISDPQTASTSRTSASGVIIYEDAAGTNTLGTDLKIYFSCDNSTWTEATSYGTATTYSGTKKLVKLGATNCTAGTSVAMKAVWANQSASKEAQLHGWAVNY